MHYFHFKLLFTVLKLIQLKVTICCVIDHFQAAAIFLFLADDLNLPENAAR